jgi:hypothetical protein
MRSSGGFGKHPTPYGTQSAHNLIGLAESVGCGILGGEVLVAGRPDWSHLSQRACPTTHRRGVFFNDSLGATFRIEAKFSGRREQFPSSVPRESLFFPKGWNAWTTANRFASW